MIAVGAATIAFGVNDILAIVTGRNFIRELTGMSEQAYMWWNLGLNIASTVLTIAGSIYKARFDARVRASLNSNEAQSLDVNDFPKDQKIHEYVKNVDSIDGYTDVAIHGNATGVELNGRMVGCKNIC